MPNLNFDVTASDNASGAFERLAAQIDKAAANLDQLGLKRVEATVKVDTAGVDAAKAKVDELAATSADVKVDADTSELDRKIATSTAHVEQLTRTPKQMKLDADTAALQAKIAKARQLVDDLALKRADPKIDADISGAERSIRLVQAHLDHLAENAKGRSQIEIDVETAQARQRLAELQARLEELRRTPARVDLDISSAEAKIGVLEAQLAGLSDATSSAGDSASSAAGSFNAMFAGIMAAYPPASTAIMALPGALSLAIVPAAAVAVGMAGITAAAAPLQGAFMDLQSVVGATFEQGLKPAITDVAAVIPTLTSGLVGTAGALSTVAVQVGAVVSSQPGMAALQATFSNVDSTITAMAPGVAGLVQNFLDLSAIGTGPLSGLATIVNGLSTQWHELIVNLTASGQAQGAISSLVGALGAILALLPPLVQEGVQLMDVLGPPLVGALQLVGGALNLLAGPLGGLTSTVLAGVVAWKLLSVVVGLDIWTALAGKLGLATAATAASTTATAASAVAAEASTAALTAEAAAATAAAGGLGRVSAAAAVAAAAQGRLAGASGAAAASTVAGAAGAGRFATALSGIGSAILPVGVALVATYMAVESMTTSTDDAVKAMQQGGQAAASMGSKVSAQTVVMDAMATKQDVVTAGISRWINTNIFHIATTQSVTDALNAERAAMTPLQLAQADATAAQGNYTKAVHDFGPASQQAAAAQQQYASATLAVTQAQSAALVASTNIDASLQAAAAHFGDAAQAADGASQSTVSYAAALASLADPMASAGAKTTAFASDTQNASDAALNLLSSSDQMNQGIQLFTSSTLKITPAMVDATGAINTTAEAGQKLVRGMAPGQELARGIEAYAKGFEQLRGATIASAQAAGDLLPVALVKGDVAMENSRQELITLMMQHGATRQQAQGLADTYLAFPPSVKTEISAPGATQAALDALGVKTAVSTLPDKKSIVVDSLTADAQTKLEDLGFTVTKLPNGKILVTADAQAAKDEVARELAAINSHEAIIPVGATMAGYNLALRDGVGAALATTGANIPVGADDGVLLAKIAAGRAKAQQPATMPVGGDNGVLLAKIAAGRGQAQTLATMPLSGDNGVLLAKVAAGRAQAQTTATMPIAGNAAGANAAIGGAQANAGRTVWMPVLANTGAANAAIDYAARTRTAVINVITSYGSVGGPALTRAAHGGAQGGIVKPMAEGGMLGGVDLTPMSGGIAQVVAPNTWRVIGDRVRDDEAFIPINGSPRSREILGQTAAAMGFGLLPKTVMDVLRQAVGVPGGSLAQRMQTATSSARPAWAQSGGDASGLIAEVRALRGDLAQALHDPRVLNIVQNNPIAERGSDSLARAARTMSTLGAVQFGARR